MQTLARLLKENEEWLTHRIVRYATEHGYSHYTSIQPEAWRISVAVLTEAFSNQIESHGGRFPFSAPTTPLPAILWGGSVCSKVVAIASGAFPWACSWGCSSITANPMWIW